MLYEFATVVPLIEQFAKIRIKYDDTASIRDPVWILFKMEIMRCVSKNAFTLPYLSVEMRHVSRRTK